MKESPKLKKIDDFLIKGKSPKANKIKKDLNSSFQESETKSESSCNTSFEETDSKPIVKYELFPVNPLPDPFKDKRLGFYPDFLSFSEKERWHFERHWIGYGGIVVKSIRSTDVDYLVHSDNVIRLKKMQKLKNKMSDNVNVRHVNKNWLIKCINDVKLYDTEKFPVYIEP